MLVTSDTTERILLSLHRANPEGHCEQCIGQNHPCATVTVIAEMQAVRAAAEMDELAHLSDTPGPEREPAKSTLDTVEPDFNWLASRKETAPPHQSWTDGKPWDSGPVSP